MEKFYLAAISNAPQLGSVRIRRLLKVFGSAEGIWTAEKIDFKQTGLPKSVIADFLEYRKKNNAAPDQLMEFCGNNHVKLCSLADDDYPPILKEIKSPPVIYYYGTLAPLANRIGVVGSRNNTDSGSKAACEIAEDLASEGFTIVSGGARGIDTFAHIGALKRGRTVAVLGCGINYAFSSGNARLIREIADNGVVMTEYAPNVQASAKTFPARNRIIAGLSRGIVVVEGKEKSGTSITCDYALKYGRDIFLLDSPSANIVRQGTFFIEDAADVIQYYAGKKMR